MRTLKIKQVDTFTDRTYTGNPACVVMEADGLDEAEMQAIAREMNKPETAFIFKPKDNSPEIEIRSKTPENEAGICGHGIIAAFHAMIEEGRVKLGNNPSVQFKVKTKQSTLPVEVNQETGKLMISFGIPAPEFSEYHGQRYELCNALSIQTELLDRTLPIWLSNHGHIFIPFVNRESLLKMKPSFDELRYLSHRSKIAGYCAFTTDTKHPSSAAHSRFFAPHLGINEDAVTGSAQGYLACYLFLNQRLKGTGTICAALEQGYEIHRGGRVWVELDINDAAVKTVKISGYAVTVMNGEIYI
ncbi:MAG: PhzF family phenazine biosynthesis protein [Chlorobiales bacterium]|nr:PhzF family phenazine biosynthesis protein [Chlorobiales bacterium]